MSHPGYMGHHSVCLYVKMLTGTTVKALGRAFTLTEFELSILLLGHSLSDMLPSVCV